MRSRRRQLSYGRNKLYFLRLRRFCQFILNFGKYGFFDGWVGKESHSVLNTAEDFRLLYCEKARVMCTMWRFLSRHKFKEAARLLTHSIHAYPMSPAWVWRVAFHIFQCLKDDTGLRSFNRILDMFLLSDENNRMLEYTLYEMSKGNLGNVQFCRANKQFVQKNKYASSYATIIREPELAHIQRLQRLYEGYSFYGMWLKQVHSLASSDDPDESRSLVDDLAEKAYHRLQEVEALVSEGHLCDTFVRALVEILKYFNEHTRAYDLLLDYAEKVPENPNTLRYLCEWHQLRQSTTDTIHSSIVLSPTHSLSNHTHNNDSSAYYTDEFSDGNTDVDRKVLRPESSSQKKSAKGSMKSSKICLKYRIAFCRRVLPEPAPSLPENYASMTKKEVKGLLRRNHPHLQTIITCLKRGKYSDALDLSFLLLDHPSWAVYCEPWRLLRKSILCIGKNNHQVLHAWSIRKTYWNQLHFSMSKLPVIGKSMKTMLNKLDSVNLMNGQSHSEDPLGVEMTIVTDYRPAVSREISSPSLTS
ncbi:unnamed protein product [Trichobilharzia szidati]|nr:unnamed protein product [Trichobilharzia szidati]